MTASEGIAFERLTVRRLPGFEEGGFELSGLSRGLSIVHGPNASGKTSTARAIRLLLWPPTGRSAQGISLAGRGRLGERRWLVEVDHGRVERQLGGQEAGPPPLPPEEHADRYRLSLHELLRSDAREADLARQIAREALGGYDVEAALAELGALKPPDYSRKADARFKESDTEVRRVDEEQARLAREAAGRDDLRRELEDAREAAVELEGVEATREWLDAHERWTEARAELGTFPEALYRTTGEERRLLEEVGERIDEAQTERQAVEVRLREARRRLGEAELPPEGVPERTLRELRARTRSLDSTERQLDLAEQELAGARKRREKARATLGERASDRSLEALGEGEWREILPMARRAERLGVEGERLRSEAAALEAPEPRGEADEGRLEEERLDQAVDYLRAWLRHGPGPPRARLVAGAALVLLLAAGVAGGLLVHPALWGLAAAAGVLGLWLWSGLRTEGAARRSLEGKYAGLGAEPPGSWEGATVEAHLERLERRWALAVLERERRRFREERLAALARRRRDLEEGVEALRRDREELLDRLGLAPELYGEVEPAPLVTLAQAVSEWRETHGEVAKREAALEELRRRRRDLVGEVSRKLQEFGLPGAEDPVEAAAGVAELEERSRIHEEVARIEGPDGDLVRVRGRIERLEAERDELYRGLGLEPGDRAGLVVLLDRREAFRRTAAEAEEARVRREAAAARLPGPPPEDRAPAELRRELEEREADLRESVDGIEPLIRRIQDLDTRIGQAKGERKLEEALAAREEAARGLLEDRERVAGGAVLQELGEWLEDQVQARHRPEVMRRASELFTEITRGRYRLLDPGGTRPAFRAWESTTGRGRSLEELSSGTRLQLQVAVRMAFVEVHERGVRPPLVLDETLANCDDASAEALIEAVLDVARTGRQVFYFTAQADEVAKWRAVLDASEDPPDWTVIDLARARGLEPAGPSVARSWSPEERPVPGADGLDRTSYGEILGVPGIDPQVPAERIHLWHLVEEPAVLHRLLAEGLEHWGQLREMTRGGDDSERGAELLGGGAGGERRWRRVVARGRCVEVLCQGWRRGRGRPVDRGVLLESGAVSERFLDEVTELAGALGGSATALLGALREGRVKRFQTAKTDELEEYLAAEGYLDDREPLDAPGLREVALRELSVELERGELTLPEVDRLLAALGMG